MHFQGPSQPDDLLLSSAAPLEIWAVAKKQAERSPMIKFKAGAVIWDPSKGEVVAKGCSHPDITLSKVYASMHAERHAIRKSVPTNLEGTWAAIYTLNGRGGCAYCSRPCVSCAISLYTVGVDRVIYAERIKHSWTIRSEHPEELVARSPEVTGNFARHQRIPS